MVAAQLANAAVALLAPFLAKAGEGFAEEVGKTSADQATGVYKAIVQRFKGDRDREALSALSRFQQNPTNQMCQKNLATKIAESAESHPQFASQLKGYFQKIDTDVWQSQFQQQFLAPVTNVVNISEVKGSLNLPK